MQFFEQTLESLIKGPDGKIHQKSSNGEPICIPRWASLKKYTSILEGVEILLFADLGDYKFYVELTSGNIYKFLYFYIYLYLIGAYHT